MTDTQPPLDLYKVVSVEQWQACQSNLQLKLSPMDEAFIHFATGEQLDRVIGKFWNKEPAFVVLTIDPERLPGRLVYECNPSGNVAYYHLYEGSIPLSAVINNRLITQDIESLR